MTLPIDISDQRFGFLVAKRRFVGAKMTPWECLCDCGNLTTVTYANLRSGNTSSCGCQKYLNRKSGRVTNREHPEYKAWDGMKTRCLNPNDAAYARYGARGIAVCDRWLESFENFLADMGPRPTAAHSIDRRDNDGPYSPSNCRWATPREQSRNRRTNVRISAFGRSQLLMEWANEVGINYQTISARLSAGWPPEAAISAPKKRGPRSDIARLTNI